MSDIATNVILADPDSGAILCQDQTILGVVRRKILRGPLVFPTVTNATWTSSAARSRYWENYVTEQVFYSPYPTAPTHDSIHDYADIGLTAVATSEWDNGLVNAGLGVYKYVTASISNYARYDTGWSQMRQVAKVFGEISFTSLSGTGHVRLKRITAARISVVVHGTVYYTVSSSPGVLALGTGTAITGTTTIDVTSQLEALNRHGTPFYVIFQGTDAGAWIDTTGSSYTVYHPAPSSEYFTWVKVLASTTALASLGHINSYALTYDAIFDGSVT